MNRQKQTKNTLSTVTDHELNRDYQDTEFGKMHGQSDTQKTEDCCYDRKQSSEDCKKSTHKTNR